MAETPKENPVYYLVGGAVRDQLLGLTPKERDWVVIGSTPDAMIKKHFQPVGRDFPVFLHPTTKEEYALARTERKTGQGHQGFTFYTAPNVSLEEDLKRRDFTINAIAMDHQQHITDPYNGQKDLELRVLRHVSPAFSEDPLRILRAARFKAQLAAFHFDIAEETRALMREMINDNQLETLSPERVFQELIKALNSSKPRLFFETLAECNAFSHILKPLAQLHHQREVMAWDTTEKNLWHTFLDLIDQPAAPEIRFSSACSVFHYIPQPPSFSLPFPKKWQQQMQDMQEHHFAYYHPPQTAPELLKQLNAFDALRRPQRLDAFLTCCHLIEKRPITTSQWQKGVHLMQSVKKETLENNQLEGIALGHALEKERCKTLEQLF